MMRASPWNSRRRLCADNVQGLIGEISIAATLLGDDTLALCAEDCLSASVAFSVPHNGERLDTRARLRRVTRAEATDEALLQSVCTSCHRIRSEAQRLAAVKASAQHRHARRHLPVPRKHPGDW